MAQLDRVLSQLRDEYSPDADAQNRVRAALAASLAASAVVGVATTKAAASAGVAGAGAAKGAAAGFPVAWVKLIAGAGMATAVVVGGSHLSQRTPQPVEQQALAPVQARASKPNRVTTAQHVEPVRDASPLAPPVAEQSQPAATPAKTRPSAANAVARTSGSQPSTMLEELSLLRRASQELRAGHSSAAQRTLDEHKRRFPNTVLGDERQGLALVASCANGRSPQNHAAAERFVQAVPTSPLADSIKRRCLQ